MMKSSNRQKRLYLLLWIILPIFMIWNATGRVLAAEEGFADEYYRVQDLGDILTDEEEQNLLSLLDEISIRQNMDVVIVTEDTLNGVDPQEYADDIYDTCHFGYGVDKDGLLLLVDMDSGSCTISTCGYGITAFTDAGIDYLLEDVTESFKDGKYAEGLTDYAEQCDTFITQARNGEPFDKGSLPREPLSPVWIVISLAVGIVVSAVIVGVMKSQLKTVYQQKKASDYVRPGSMRLTQQSDQFLYRNVERIEKPKENKSGSGSTTHSSSSGTTHGGGTKSFK